MRSACVPRPWHLLDAGRVARFLATTHDVVGHYLRSDSRQLRRPSVGGFCRVRRATKSLRYDPSAFAT